MAFIAVRGRYRTCCCKVDGANIAGILRQPLSCVNENAEFSRRAQDVLTVRSNVYRAVDNE